MRNAVWSRPWRDVTVDAAKLFSNATSTSVLKRGREAAAILADDVDRRDSYVGLSLDPLSDLRQLVVWFDDDPTPIALVGAQLIARPFRELRIAPLHPATACTLTLADTLPADSTPGTTQLCPQVVRLRLWADVPRGLELCPLASALHFLSPLITTTAAISDVPVMLLHVPGARRVRLFATNEDQALAASVLVELYGVRPELDLAENAATSPLLIATSGYDVTIGTTADDRKPVSRTILDPGLHELCVVATCTDVATFRVGVAVDFDQGA